MFGGSDPGKKMRRWNNASSTLWGNRLVCFLAGLLVAKLLIDASCSSSLGAPTGASTAGAPTGNTAAASSTSSTTSTTSTSTERRRTTEDDDDTTLYDSGAVDAGKYVEFTSARRPTKLLSDGNLGPLSVAERLRLLELKVASSINWMSNPRLGSMETVKCQSMKKFGDINVCLDRIRKNDCIVYDFGLRKEPDLGFFFAEEYGCEVHGFDPSPISVEYFEKNKDKVDALKKYHFHPVGASGTDGDLTLFEYNWGQVSSVQYPYHLDRDQCKDRDSGPSEEEKRFGSKICQSVKPSEFQKPFKLAVRTLWTIMKSLGHTHLDLLKIDVEGSEYQFLEEAFDTLGCLPVEQIAMEFHHHSLDPRYGGGSSPNVNGIALQMQACGHDLFFVRDRDGGHCDGHKWWFDAGLMFRYQHVSFMKNGEKLPQPTKISVPGFD